MVINGGPWVGWGGVYQSESLRRGRRPADPPASMQLPSHFHT